MIDGSSNLTLFPSSLVDSPLILTVTERSTKVITGLSSENAAISHGAYLVDYPIPMDDR